MRFLCLFINFLIFFFLFFATGDNNYYLQGGCTYYTYTHIRPVLPTHGGIRFTRVIGTRTQFSATYQRPGSREPLKCAHVRRVGTSFRVCTFCLFVRLLYTDRKSTPQRVETIIYRRLPRRNRTREPNSSDRVRARFPAALPDRPRKHPSAFTRSEDVANNSIAACWRNIENDL